MKDKQQQKENRVLRQLILVVMGVRDSNINGDPDDESMPRTHADGRGIVTAVSVKCKIKQLIGDKDGFAWQLLGEGLDPEQYHIYHSPDNVASELEREATADFEAFSKKYWDARLFGNMLVEGADNKKARQAAEKAAEGDDEVVKSKKAPRANGAKKTDHKRSAVITGAIGYSTDSITGKIIELTTTSRMGVQDGKDRGMAPSGMKVVSFAPYTLPFFVNPQAARLTYCTQTDVELFEKALPLVYVLTRSQSRSNIEVKAVHVLTAKTPFGFAESQLIDALSPTLKPGLTVGTKESDYNWPTWEDVPADLKKDVSDYKEMVSEMRKVSENA